MLAVHFAQGKAKIIDIPQPRQRKGYALLKLRLAGICNTDIELLNGYYDFRGIPGHEFVADVVKATDSSLVGKRVVGEINIGCGKCAACRSGLRRHCARRSVLGIVRHPGAFAEYLTLPESNLFVVPSSISDEHAVFTEPLAAACQILEQVRFPKRAPVAVLGDGKLGLLIAQMLHLHGLAVTVYGHNLSKLRILKALSIETRVVARSSSSPFKPTYPYVVDSTGSPAGFRSALSLLMPRGTLILKSTVRDCLEIDTAPIIVNEISILGSRCGRFEPALKLLKSRQLVLDPMLHARFPLIDAAAALDFAQTPGALKVLLA